MISIPFEKISIISTCHITASDGRLMHRATTVPLLLFTRPEGCIFRAMDNSDDDVLDLRSFGFSEYFVNLMLYASVNASYVLFDCDAVPIAGIPKFAW